MSGRATTISVLLLSAAVLAACTGTETGGASDVRPRAADGGGGTAVPSGAVAAGSRAGPDADATAHVVRSAPQLILTGSLAVVVRSVERSSARAEQFAAAAGGRTDADDQHSPRGSRPSAQLTLRVPNAAVPSVLDRLAALGHETDRHLSTRDVTTQVADVASRVASARAAIASLRALYARATKVGDVIRIEASLSQREASLESLQARQRSLTRQVALATITVQLTRRKAAAVPTTNGQRAGFVGGLVRGWHAFTAVVAGLALALGAVLPFLLVVAVLALLGLLVRRRLRPRSGVEAGSE